MALAFDGRMSGQPRDAGKPGPRVGLHGWVTPIDLDWTAETDEIVSGEKAIQCAALSRRVWPLPTILVENLA